MGLFRSKSETLREKGSKAWSQLGEQEVSDTTAYQDVHGTQQLERGEIEEKLTPTSRNVAAIVFGIVAFIVIWLLMSFAAMGVNAAKDAMWKSSVPAHAVSNKELSKKLDIPSWKENCFSPAMKDGNPDPKDQTCYPDAESVPEPKWHKEAVKQEQVDREAELAQRPQGGMGYILDPYGLKVVVSLLAGLVTWSVLRLVLMRNLRAQNLMRDTTDINQYTNDGHIALPEEVREKFDVVPDVGAHTSVSATTLISHSMVSNTSKIKHVDVAQRAKEDIKDSDGDVVVHKGEILHDDDGNALVKSLPMFDEEFGTALWDASGLPNEKSLRRRLNPQQIPYNPNDANRDKLKGYNSLADLINGDWEFPLYEPQRPAGVYYVDTSPANTMILAMTRAGKGQTYIEPQIDVWSRQKRGDNMVINDPKGELLVKNYVRLTMRGYQVVQFNLINASKTDIYNPLGLAAEAARESDMTQSAMYVENIADVFFPVDGADDPVWPNAANNAFKRAAFGLIDYYLEEERILRQRAQREGMDQKILDQKLDEMWGKVTLYNCYQLFTQLTSKKRKSPMTQINERIKSGYYDERYPQDPQGADEAIAADKAEAELIEFLWEGNPEVDLLTLFFNATEALPRSSMRTLISNANNALRAMAGAEKMLASVYGIAITAMSFFTDPTISTLTSGTPSQNTDLGGLSFPRRIGVRFAPNFTQRDKLIGLQVKWDAFADPELKEPLGSDFEHEDMVSREGWARYYFDGKFPNSTAYLRLRLMNAETGVLVRTLYFKFTKGYQVSLNGRRFIKDPITNEKIVRNGTLVEMVKDSDGVLVKGNLRYPSVRLATDEAGDTYPVNEDVPAVVLTTVRYSEQPKAVFLVTPPHLTKYAKLLLVLLKQLVDLNFEKSYMTKSSQKPLYKTRFMLDELGNLQSDGHGIASFQTMLSIGLGQEQQFTLILQTLQQLMDVYGDSADKIIQGNIANIIFLKSTDDTMIETLTKMSGVQHRVVRDSKTVTQDTQQIIKGMNVEGKVSYNLTAKEETVISYNDLAFLSERNSIVFSAGFWPIWNRNAEILPMSWRLFKDTIQKPGFNYSLQTIPTLSSALDFDVRLNQPNFTAMLDHRIAQAAEAERAAQLYQKAHGLSDYQVSLLDPDVYSGDVMDLIDTLREKKALDAREYEEYDMDSPEAAHMMMGDQFSFDDSENEELMFQKVKLEAQMKDHALKRYAHGTVSREDLMSMGGQPTHALDEDIIAAFRETRHSLVSDTRFFLTDENGSLYGKAGDGQRGALYVSQEGATENLKALQEAAEDDESKVYGDEETVAQVSEIGSWKIHDGFYRFLVSLESWEDLGNGAFDDAMGRLVASKIEEVSGL